MAAINAYKSADPKHFLDLKGDASGTDIRLSAIPGANIKQSAKIR
jgi:hypothetical protein